MATAEALEVVGEERLEWGSLIVCAAVGALVCLARTTGPASSMITPGMANMGGHKGLRVLLRLNLFTIPALLPTAFHSIVRACRKQKAQLELESVGAVGKSAEKDGAGGVLELEGGVAEKLVEPRFIGFLRRSRSLKPT
ncbi:adenosylhomocysteinase [Babesia caballi]|uniref:Adenosylhomocysteinase n=1 Tax=Babesia caballi TaxID=5871 RepID=A0AAV4LWL7_BABCB|nr:adenosylhomocysteinase [Babesia caballi]